MTAIEALEAYSASHPETVDELLEWPFRRFNAAFQAWGRREAIAHIDERKEAHIDAMIANGNIEDLGGAIEEVTDFYNRQKDEASVTEAERKEIEAAFDTPFMRASGRAVARALEGYETEIEMPGQRAFQRLPEE